MMIKNKRKPQLYYLVGPSGSGKDSVLSYFRQHLGDHYPYPAVVAHRYITRKQDSTENSIALSATEFRMRLGHQLFAMNWKANGLDYAIGIEINLWLEAGISVIINGSRAHLPVASHLYGKRLHSIGIQVSDDILEQRLRQRNRETEDEIQQRLQRHYYLRQQAETHSVINNDSSIEYAALQLLKIVNR